MATREDEERAQREQRLERKVEQTHSAGAQFSTYYGVSPEQGWLGQIIERKGVEAIREHLERMDRHNRLEKGPTYQDLKAARGPGIAGPPPRPRKPSRPAGE